jgi:hypothetical protein
MNFNEKPQLNKGENMKNFIEFKSGARKLHSLIIQLSGIIELDNDIKSIQARTRAETAVNLLQEMPNEIDKSMFEFRNKVLHECKQGIDVFEPKDDLDRTIKKDAIEIINQLEAFEK